MRTLRRDRLAGAISIALDYDELKCLVMTGLVAGMTNFGTFHESKISA
jgi:hypothetical protein